MKLVGGPSGIGAMLGDPPLDIFGQPDLAHGKDADRLGEVRSRHQLLHALTADIEPLLYLGGAHLVMHDRKHSFKTTGHLTRTAMISKTSRVTSDLLIERQLSLFDRSHETCTHTKYMLTCAQYVEILARGGGFCELCRAAGIDQLHGKLCIDHDHEYGLWAVRGLLCGRCNLRAATRPHLLPGLDEYLANSWYLGAVERHGFVLGVPEEPSVGATVSAPRKRTYERIPDGWLRLDPRPHRPPMRMVRTWPWLIHQFGAHNLRISGRDM